MNRLYTGTHFFLSVLLIILMIPFRGYSLGVLTHEAIIDAEWNDAILPLLKFKYPNSTDSQFTAARAYAYGGAVTPDMGYYPFGSKIFTDLVHYVRSGDLVDALLNDADSLNAFAFALGFLSHYYADVYGHPLATNRSVPIMYPKLEKKFGDVVTYADDRISHIRIEFSFDVVEVAKGNYAAQSYHDFIGFKVDTGLLAKAFNEIYGLNLHEIFKNHLALSVETFRFMIANVFPEITKAAWSSKGKKSFQTDTTKTSEVFRYKMHMKQYNKEFGTGYKRPGFFASGLAFVVKVMPKVGPLRALKFKVPDAQTEKKFIQSFDTITIHYAHNVALERFKEIDLKNKNYDTGNPTEKCEYVLTDATYENWLLKLNNDSLREVTPLIKQNLANFYQQIQAPPSGKSYKECDKVYKAVENVRQLN